MSKDQAIGGAIFVVCLLVAIGYIITLFIPSVFIEVFKFLGLTGITEEAVHFWIIAIPVFIAFVAIMFIGAWIGWTMATTPPPKPIEEITTEVEETTETKMPEEETSKKS
jgi:uncharacterized BrkB/YihY/UPF0761 family membrane protein